MPYKKKEKVSLMLYYDYLEQFECLTDEQLRKLIYAMIEFDKNGNEQKLDKVTKMAFIPIRKRLILDKKKWEDTCKANSENAKKRWNNENTTVCDRMPKDAKYTDIERDIDKEKEKDKERESNNIYPTDTPTLSELHSFCQENNMEEFDCEYFYDYYEANGWIDGRGNKIKNWKSKVKNWYKNDLSSGKIKQKVKEEIDTRKIREDEDGKYYQLNSDGTRYYI